MPSYQQAYQSLNDAQRSAVDRTDGPVLVIAGPGTGKTQLLTTRIAHILDTTDTLPENILCMTFTDAAAVNMRERLAGMIGQSAYRVTIGTYHAFGSDLLRRYPEFFAEALELQPADALRIDEVLRSVQASLPYSNGLKNEVFLRDITSLMSDFKRALLAPADVLTIADYNESFVSAASVITTEHIGSLARISKASIPMFEMLLDASETLPREQAANTQSLAELWTVSLGEAIDEVHASNKTTALTAWKNRWLAKDSRGVFIADGARAARKLRDAAEVYKRYLKQLTKQGLFDYDDMILQAINGLSNNDELRFTLQEKYQYVLLDEFQDTNAAQLKLVELLTDNPVHEGRPNVLAVGDDDQAIYAFQGADYSHMRAFHEMYRDTFVVTLTQNYRSTADIVQTGMRISGQIVERLHHHFPGIDKQLTAANTSLADGAIERHEFLGDLSQNAWVAHRIRGLIDIGTPANDIAVLAPKHQYLESLVPFLHEQNVAVHYEKREDVLRDPAIVEVITMSRLTAALAANDHQTADALWPEVLSLPFWGLSTSLIWEISWQSAKQHWAQILYAEEQTRPIALFFIALSQRIRTDPLETMLDYLLGISTLELREDDITSFKSPYYKHYFGDSVPAADEPVPFWQLLANITVLRQRLRDYRNEDGSLPTLVDFLRFVAAYQTAGIQILNTNPYQEAEQAVQLMTAYKSKGQEFAAVFVVALNDEVWGSRARTQASRIAIPENLRFIRYAGATEDERLRLFYVAVTRARTQLYLANFTTTFSGSKQSRLKYLDERPDENGVVSPLLPTGSQQVQAEDMTPPSLKELDVYWHGRHREAAQGPEMRSLLQGRLSTFQLSASNLSRYTDTSIDGPTSFLLRDLLRFPSGSSLSGIYGDVIHASLQWTQQQLAITGSLPEPQALTDRLATLLQDKRLNADDTAQLIERGTRCLETYMAQHGARLRADDVSEYNFRGEGVMVQGAHLSGKIDRLVVNKVDKTITIIDYKTGRSHDRWTTELKMLRYRQQLYFYKLLVERSAVYAGYTVADAYLEFVEPNDDGEVVRLKLSYESDELAAFEQLIGSVWRHVKALDFPDVSQYGDDAKAVKRFQQDLIEAST